MKAKVPLKAKTPLKSKAVLKAKSKPKKQKKPTITKLKHAADKWHSLATRLRFADFKDGEWWAKCFTCPNYKPIKQLQCGHFQSRMHNSTRFEEENTAPQCYGCNVMHQGRQYEFAKQIDLYYGKDTADKLAEMATHPHQFKPEELLEIITDRRQQVEFYEAQHG